jgi:transcriptional regulator with XRE-family HTH domain
MNNMANTLGNRVKTLRNQKNMTQLELSRAVSCDRSMIGYVESGERTPGLGMLAKIAAALAVPVSHLLQ